MQTKSVGKQRIVVSGFFSSVCYLIANHNFWKVCFFRCVTVHTVLVFTQNYRFRLM